jgi:hypothetical protein
LPHLENKHGISIRTFQRPVYFAKAMAPDLSQPDFSLWGHFKGHVHNNNPHSIEELKANNEGAISNLNHNTLHWVACNTVKKVGAHIQGRGRQFQHIL